MSTHGPLGLVVLLALAAPGAAAEVLSKAPSGFVIAQELRLEAPPKRAYDALTAEVGAWWDAAHSYSGRADNLTLEARAGGCFCERLSGGGSALHLRVVFASPGKRLRMTGGLGPLQGMGASGSMDFDFSPADGGSRLSFRYTVSGYHPDGLGAMAKPVDQVMAGQLARLAAYLKTGDPEGAAR